MSCFCISPSRRSTQPLSCPSSPRRADDLGGLDLVAAELGDGAVDRLSVLGGLVLDDADGDAVDCEHQVGAVAFAGRGLEDPLPAHVKGVGACVLEVDEGDVAMA